MNTILRLSISIFLLWGGIVNCQSKMVEIKGGTYIPLYGRDSLQVTISDFYMDVYPVTNQEFLDFVKTNSKWKKSQVKKLFADGNYLVSWESDTELGNS